VIDIDTSQDRSLAEQVEALAWSPDGRNIAYERSLPGPLGNSDLHIVDAQVWQERVSIDHARIPAWSADSTEIAHGRAS
jgi:hypothetical protein